MKALEKDRTRRYETARELATDVERHLTSEPILASPPGAAYKFHKFVKRNRVAVTAGSLVAAALVVGLLLSTIGFVQASRQRERAEAARNEAEQARQAEADQRRIAEDAQREAQQNLALAEQRESQATKARDAAQRQLKMTRSINDFLNNELLAAVAPEQQGKDVLMRDVLDTASEAIEGKFDDAPLIEASIRSTLGVTYYRLGDYTKAEPHLVQALEIRRTRQGAEHEDTLDSMNNLAALYSQKARFDEAELLYVKTLENRRRVLGEEHLGTLASMNNLANLYSDQRRFDEAEPLYVKSRELTRRVLGEEHPRTLDSMNHLAILYSRQRRFDEAEPLFVKTLELMRRVLGEEHLHTQQTRRNLLGLFNMTGKLDQAGPLVADLLASYRKRAIGPDASANDMNEYAWQLLTCVVHDLRDPVTALEFAKKAVEASNEQSPAILDTLALAQQMNEEIDRAIETQTKAVALLDPGPYALRSELESNLVKYLLEGRRFAKAESLLLAMHEQIVGSSNEAPSQTQASLKRLVSLYESWHTAKPDQGYDAKAAEWRAKLPPRPSDSGGDD